MGIVYLVGAGPGDPGLITVKGLNLIKNCDALIYDRLGTRELISLTKEGCKKIYVGKKAGAHYKKQNEINEILIEACQKYDMVVRLKGGDPYVFGRGGEEIMALREADIPYEVVPGITSSISVPELSGIPVTHRGLARSFHVVTGHTMDDTMSDIKAYDGTTVILMGLSNLPQIVKKLIEDGAGKNTPVSVISNGSLSLEKRVTGTLEDIIYKVKEENMTSPAIIVTGEAAGYDFRVSKNDSLHSLVGKRIGITATKALREKFENEFMKYGARVYTLCDMQPDRTKEYGSFSEKLHSLKDYSWVVFTSRNAINLFFDEMVNENIDYRSLCDIRFAVIGSGTKRRLLEKGFSPDYMPDEYTGRALAEGLAANVADGEKLLIPRAARGSRILTEILDEHNISYDDMPIYDVKGRMYTDKTMVDCYDILVFASSSGVEAFFANDEGMAAAIKKSRIKTACIGQITADELLKYGIKADIVPEKFDVPGMVESVVKYYSQIV